MNKSISLILHLERLPQNDTIDEYCYSLNVSAAFDQVTKKKGDLPDESDQSLDEGELKPFICPWRWEFPQEANAHTDWKKLDRKSTRLNSSHVSISYAV